MKELVLITTGEMTELVLRIVTPTVNNQRYGFVIHNKQRLYVEKVLSDPQHRYRGAAWVTVHEPTEYKAGDRVTVRFPDGAQHSATVSAACPSGLSQSLAVRLDEPYTVEGKSLVNFVFSSTDMAVRKLEKQDNGRTE